VSRADASSIPELPAPRAASWLRGTGPVVAGVVLALIVHALIAPRLPQLYAKILLDIGINIILAVSLNIVNGFTGQFSIGHAGFMAIGGYTGASVGYYGSFLLWNSTAFRGGFLSITQTATLHGAPLAGGDVLFLAACLTGGLVAAGVGLVVGLPSIRLRGDYLAIVTLGFGEIVRILIQQTPGQLLTADAIAQTSPLRRFWHMGGALGFSRLPFYTSQFWVWLFVVATLLTAFRLRQSTYGRAFLAIRENEIAAEAMGVPVTRYKVKAFVLAAFFAGIAGCLFAHQVGTTLNPGELGFQKSFDILIMVVLGGMGSISGSVLAAIILTLLPELLREPPPVWPAGVVVAALLLALKRRRGVRPAIIVVLLAAALEAARATALAYDVDLSRYRMILYALTLVLTMILRPQGLLGVRELWELRRPRAARRAVTGDAA